MAAAPHAWLWLLAGALASLPTGASADTAQGAGTRVVREADDLPGWVRDIQAGQVDLDRSLAGLADAASGLGAAADRIDSAAGAAPRRGLGLVVAILSPSDGAGLIEALSAPRPVLRARPVLGELSSSFGVRQDPIRKRRQQDHKGIDIRAERGTPVYAAGPGVVARAGRQRGYGRVIYVDHGDGLQTRYAHLESIGVSTGAPVAAGERIGRVGSSGRATGPHLHFEVRREGAPVAPDQIAELPLFGDRAGLFEAALGPLVRRMARVGAVEPGAEVVARKPDKSLKKQGKRRHKRPAQRELRSRQPRS